MKANVKYYWRCIQLFNMLNNISQHAKSSNNMKKSNHGEDIEELPGVKVEESTNEWKNLLLLWWVGWMEMDQELKHLSRTHKHTHTHSKTGTDIALTHKYLEYFTYNHYCSISLVDTVVLSPPDHIPDHQVWDSNKKRDWAN